MAFYQKCSYVYYVMISRWDHVFVCYVNWQCYGKVTRVYTAFMCGEGKSQKGYGKPKGALVMP